MCCTLLPKSQSEKCSCHSAGDCEVVCFAPFPGGMQDYNYAFGGCMELTLEISCCKFPEEDDLAQFWEDNKNSLITFMQLAHIGKDFKL